MSIADLTFEEWMDLNESPVAVLDDWRGFLKKAEQEIGEIAFTKGWWVKVGDINDAELYKSESSETYILGYWDAKREDSSKKIFRVIVKMFLIYRPDLKRLFKKPHQVSKVETAKEYRSQGYAIGLYEWFLDNGYTLISDSVQFDGAGAIYSRLSNKDSIVADVFDHQTHEMIKADTKVFQHRSDMWDFDYDVWSLNNDKMNIRIALHKK